MGLTLRRSAGRRWEAMGGDGRRWEAMGGDGREGDKTRVNEGALIEFVYTSSFPKWRV